jgi:hypothetical protein
LAPANGNRAADFVRAAARATGLEQALKSPAAFSGSDEAKKTLEELKR